MSSFKPQRKWLRSPHNRFKEHQCHKLEIKVYKQMKKMIRSQQMQTSNKLRLISTEESFKQQEATLTGSRKYLWSPIFMVVCLALVLSFCCSAMAMELPESTGNTTRASTKPIRTLKLEEEVELSTRSARNQAGQMQLQRKRDSRLYRLRSPQLNGRLEGPVQLVEPPRAQQQVEQRNGTSSLDCNQEEQQTGVAASSPTLRLNSSNRKWTPQLVAGRAMGEVNELEPEQSGRSSVEIRQPTIFDLNGGGFSETKSSSSSSRAQANESILSLIDEFDSKITTNRTKAQLSCDSGEMILRLNFTEPFKGIVYPDHNRLSPCRFFGDGHHNYELRLPLRGCGTRQVASRVFINDVVIRFHKTLELEEDEVKTLICRYPPPMAPIPLDGGNDFLLPSLTGNRPAIGTVSPGGANAQFEFVDLQLAGRNPASRPSEPGSSGTIETFSENLVVAPASGQHPHQVSDLNSYSHRSSANLRNRPSDPFNPRSSFGNSLTNPSSPFATTTDEAIGNSASAETTRIGLIDRLSSIELLFLISSLMFLLLLALGLAASYYCFRRQSNRTANQRASAILKRKRRYLDSSAQLSPASFPTSPTSLQHCQHQLHANSHYAPSSPESDLSGRGLLAPVSSRHYSVGAQQPPRAPYYFNGAYAPTEHLPVDGVSGVHRNVRPESGRYRAPPPVAGRRETIYANQANYGLGRSVHHHHHQFPALGRKSQNLQWTSTRDKSQPLFERYPPLNKPPNRSVNRSSKSREQQQHQIYMNTNRVANLNRAKSMSSVQPGSDQWPNSQQVPIGGTLSRHERFTGQKMRPQGLQRHPKSIIHRCSGHHQRRDCESPVSGSDSERATTTDLKPPKSSRLLLKSIEDSYITNYTEIHEQEYLERDSRRPLSLSEWRAMQPLKSQVEPMPKMVSDSEGSETDEGARNGYQSAQTNMRSLTELDVQYVKSLPMSPLLDGARQIRSAISVDHLGQATADNEERYKEARDRSSSLTEMMNGNLKNETSLVREAPALLLSSPDLILSPEYEHNRLRLERPNSSASHNSVSYV